ncbi:MAG: antitoxin component YwqK of YwqJK toxin-antitoxin module [Bacteroidia bacterium]|jgi:antitoxin component YwqK of YwqJK toxin-antitoxin module
MKKLAFLFSLVVFAACSMDELTPCIDDGPEGELCREYRYFNESPEGYVEFKSSGDSVAISDFYNPNSKLVKTITERFENGQIRVVSEQFPNEASRVRTLHYNEIDSLWRVVYGANDSVLEITYENGKRLQDAYFHNGELKRYFLYRYFLDDGKLYRIYAYGADRVQLSYRNFDYFSTGQTRISSFTVDHKLIGREVYNSQNDLLTFVQFTDSTGTVTERADYIYDAAFNLTEKTEIKAEQTYKSIFLYY